MFSEHFKQEFKRILSWNKYKSEMTTQPNNNNLDQMIDPTFSYINGLFVKSFKVGEMILQEILLLNASRNQRL